MTPTYSIHRRGTGRKGSYRLLRLLLSLPCTLWSPATDRRLTVLFFHRVRLSHDPLFPSEPVKADFAAAMEVVAGCFNCLPLEEATARLLSGRSLPSRAVAITFDDGYADNFTEAMPILQRHGLTATFFIASGFLDGGCMWNDEALELLRNFPGQEIDLRPLGLGISPCRNDKERMAVMAAVNGCLKYRDLAKRREMLDALRSITGAAKLPDLMLSSDQVRQMHAAGMCIGGHTLSHPILACIDDAQAWREIGEDRERLGAITGVAPTLFAYPNGKPGRDYDARHTAMVRAAGYRAAVTTTWGAAGNGVDLYQIPRFTPWDRRPSHFALRLAHNYTRKQFRLA